MALISNGRLTDDPWVTAADEVALPASGPVVVSLDRWRAERDALLARGGLLGIRLASHQLASEIAADIQCHVCNCLSHQPREMRVFLRGGARLGELGIFTLTRCFKSRSFAMVLIVIRRIIVFRYRCEAEMNITGLPVVRPSRQADPVISRSR